MNEYEVTKLRKQLQRKQEQLKEQKQDHVNTQRQLVQVQAERDRFYSELIIARKTIENVDQIIAENIREMKLKIQKQNSQSLGELQRLRQKLVEEKLLRQKLEEDTKNKQSVISELSLRLRQMSRKYKDPSLLVNTRQVADQVAITNNNYYKLTQKYNKLCSDMQNILAQNKILRKLHGVPDNFGFDLEEIKIAQKQELQDYKSQCRKLQTEIQQLQAQRTQLRYRLRQYNTLYSTKGERYKDMTQQQMDLLDQYALNLKQGKFQLPQIDKTQKQMERQIIKLKGQIQILQNKGGNYSRPVENQQVSVQHLKKMQEQMNKLINPLRDQMRKLAEVNNSKAINQDYSSQQIVNNNSNVNVVFDSKFKAPIPLPASHNDWHNIKDGFSYMFNSKIPINMKDFGSEVQFNMVKAKYQIAALQLQNIESLKILKQKQSKQYTLYNELNDLKQKYTKCLRVQDQLFIRYFKQKEEVNDRVHKLQIERNNMINDQRELQTKLGIIQDSYNALVKKSDIQKRNEQLTNKLAISQSELHKLKKIYNVLNQQHKALRLTYINLQSKASAAEHSLRQKLAVTKQNEKKLTFYINKILQEKVNSVSGQLHNSVVTKLQCLTDKSMNSAMKQTELRVKINKLQNIQRQINRKQDLIQTLRENSFDINLQLQILKSRLQNTDVDYRAFQNIFRKFIAFVNHNNISLMTYFKKFDKDGSGQLGKNQFLSAIKGLNFQISNNQFQLMFNQFDLDGSQTITYQQFIRKMRRSGALSRNKQQQGLFRLFKAIKDAKITVRKAFQIIDLDGSNSIKKSQMTEAFRKIGIDSSTSTIDYIFRVCDSDNSGTINANEFQKLFEDIIKQSALQEHDIFSNQMDWKLMFVLTMDQMSTKFHKGGLKQTFKSLDTDGSLVLTINELKQFFQKANIQIASKNVVQLFQFLDRQRDGKVQYVQFLKILQQAKQEKRRVDRNKYIKTRIEQLRKQNQGRPEVSNSKISEEKSSQVRIMALQAKLGSLIKKNQKMIKLVATKQQQQIQVKRQIQQLQKNIDKIRDQYYKEKGKTADLQAKLSKMLNQQKSLKILQRSKTIQVQNLQIKGQLQNYKSMFVSLDAKLRQDQMRQAKIISQNQKYYQIVKQLQGKSDIAAQLGKRAQQLQYSKRNEEIVNQKYQSAIQQVRLLQSQNSKLLKQNYEKQQQIIKTHYLMQNKSQLLQKTIDDLSTKIFPTISAHRIQELLMKIREISNSKSQIQKQLKQLAEVNYNLQLRNDYIQNQKVHIDELEKKLKRTYTDQSSVTIIELTKKLSEYKMNQLKAKRQCGLLKQKQQYYIRLNNNNNQNIKEIQEELASWERKYNQRQQFWRTRMAQQMKMVEDIQKQAVKTKQQQRNAQIFFKEQQKNNQKIDNQFKSLPSQKQVMLSSVIRRTSNNGSENIVFELKTKIHELQQQLAAKQKQIYQLKSTFKQIVPQARFTDFSGQMGASTANFVMQTQLTTSQLKNNARRFINNQKQSQNYYKEQASKITMAAQQSIQTLQRMIDDKNDQLKRKQKIIEDLKKDFFKIKEQDTRQIQKLHQEIRQLRTKSQTANLTDIMSRPTGKNFYKGGDEVERLRIMISQKQEQIKVLQQRNDTLMLSKVKQNGEYQMQTQKALQKNINELQKQREVQRKRYLENEEQLNQKIRNLQKLSKQKDVKLAKLQKTLLDLKNMAINEGKKVQGEQMQKQLEEAIQKIKKGTSVNNSQAETLVQKSLQTVQELTKKNKQYELQNKRLRQQKFNRTTSKRK